ncbi:MAG: hypothetical protein AAGN35_17575 [Bacteroidota bacterium]
MMRRAYFGTNALILLGIHVLLVVLDVAGVITYFRTLFYPMFNLLALMLAVLGLLERDKQKGPSIIALIGLGLSLAFWVIALFLRLQS